MLIGSYRQRIRELEYGASMPSGDELIAFSFIFNRTGPDLFPSYADTVQDAVMAAASCLSKGIEDDESPRARRKYELFQDMLGRVTSHVEYV